MAQPPSSTNVLRAYTYRLSSTPIKHLPKVAAQISGGLWNCRDVLSSPSEGKQLSTASSAAHKYKTHLTSLLQDRTIEGRWSGVVLLKATIEAGGLEILSKSNTWVRCLLGILKKPEPPTTRSLAIMTLTRIFMLTWDHSNLVREITTPGLTAFIPMCISGVENSRCSPEELQAILDAISTLLPRHPTIFRTHENKLRDLLTTLLSSRTSFEDKPTKYFSERHEAAARKILVQLHSCVPKQGGSDQWQETLRAVVHAAHATGNTLFRAVHEDWQSATDGPPSKTGNLIMKGEVGFEEVDLAGLKPWKGIFAGTDRFTCLLRLIECHLATSTPGTVSVAVGLISDLLTRLFDLKIPSPGTETGIQFNNQISKDEREALLAVLPDIHVAAIQLASTLCNRLKTMSLAGAQNILEQVIAVFASERYNVALRQACYGLVEQIVVLTGPTMVRYEVAELEPLLRHCCDDVLDCYEPVAGAGFVNDINQQLGLSGPGPRRSHSSDHEKIRQTAAQLLCTCLVKINSQTLSGGVRARIDRIVVLTRNQDALVASVMNPPAKHDERRAQPSLLPILARQFSGATSVEAIIRPRLPPLHMSHTTVFIDDDDGSDNGAVQMSESPELGGSRLAMSTDGFPTQVDGKSTEQAPMPATSDLSSERDEAYPGKRKALDETEETSNIKRMREWYDAETTAISSLPISTENSPPLHIVEGEDTSLRDAARSYTTPNPDNDVEEDNIPESYHSAEAASDESDFELPPLTMEPDTEDEDED